MQRAIQRQKLMQGDLSYVETSLSSSGANPSTRYKLNQSVPVGSLPETRASFHAPGIPSVNVRRDYGIHPAQLMEFPHFQAAGEILQKGVSSLIHQRAKNIYHIDSKRRKEEERVAKEAKKAATKAAVKTRTGGSSTKPSTDEDYEEGSVPARPGLDVLVGQTPQDPQDPQMATTPAAPTAPIKTQKPSNFRAIPDPDGGFNDRSNEQTHPSSWGSAIASGNARFWMGFETPTQPKAAAIAEGNWDSADPKLPHEVRFNRAMGWTDRGNTKGDPKPPASPSAKKPPKA